MAEQKRPVIVLSTRTSVEKEGDAFLTQSFEIPQDETSRKELAEIIFDKYTPEHQKRIISTVKETPGIGMVYAAFQDLGVGSDREIGIDAVDLRLQRLIEQANTLQS